MKTLLAALALVVPLAAGHAAAPAVPVLTYHRFDPIASHSATIVTTPVFEQQMAWLAAHRYRVVPLREVVAATLGNAPPIEGPAVAITADDGWRSVYTQMFPVIRREHLPVTLFINPPMISAGSAYLTWEMIAEMRASGLVDIEAHTQTHPNFNTERARRTPEAYAAYLTQQIGGSREALQARFGVAADLLAWPFGIHDAQLEAAARQGGFVAAFALGSRAAEPGGDPFAIPRYQVYETDIGARFAAVAEGFPRGRGVVQASSSRPIPSSTPRKAAISP